ATLVLPTDASVSPTARDSLDEALLAAESLDPALAKQLVFLARAAFDNAFVGVVGLAVIMLLATAGTVWWVTRRPTATGPARMPVR
ncbi:MAG: MFS transporter, partial [Neoaquamicrobium sediminum]